MVVGVEISSRVVEQEVGDHGGQLVRLGEQAEMPVVVDVQGGVWQESGHDPGVGQGDDRVVGSGQDQGRLPQERQRGEAGPADAGEKLEQVSAS